MTRNQAFDAASARFGGKGLVVVGRNEQYRDKPLYVGVKERGSFTMFGAGASWEEALAAVVPVIDLGNGKFKKKETT